MKKREHLVRFLVGANKIDEVFCATLPDNDAKLMLHTAIVAKLNDLLALGLIELNHDEGNRRTKFLIPTQTSLKLFDELALTLSQSLATD